MIQLAVFRYVITMDGCMILMSLAFFNNSEWSDEEPFGSTHGQGVVDSACSLGRYPFLLKSYQTLPTDAIQHVVLVNDELVLIWQSSDWGLRGLQGPSP
jgi:hypothetical protein